MANYSELYRIGGSITQDELYNHLQEINKDRFNGTLPIKKSSDGILFIGEENGFYWWFNNTPHIKYENCDTEGNCDEIPESINYFDFKDSPNTDYLRWFQEIILKELIARTDLDCFITCIGEYMKPSGCPSTYSDFIYRHSSYSGKGIITKYILQRMRDKDIKYWVDRAKESLPQDLFESMF